MTKKFNPKNKTCVVTGGSAGIGQALCVELANRGASNVINIDINPSTIDSDYYNVDVGNQTELIKAINDIKSKYGAIDLYCSNAGVASMDNHEDDLSLWKHIMDVNFYPSVIAMQTCLPDMIKAKQGNFLITSSAAGLLTMPGSATYTVTKHAVRALAEWMAMTYTTQGIGTHVLCPQKVDSQMTNNDHPYHMKLNEGNIHGESMSASKVSTIALDTMAQGKFMISTHKVLQEYVEHKATNIEEWMRINIGVYDTYIHELFTSKKVD